jgi:hypothetical protein
LYDPLRNRYRFTCPVESAADDRPLSAFRAIERLPGPGHPAVYRVHYVCAVCGDEHPALLSERELDCGPVSPSTDLEFVNILTGRSEPVADEITDAAERHLRRGNWPWTFYCACEHEVRPGYPSHLARLSPAEDARVVGVAVRCACCGGVSINLVSQRHLDEPFYHDRVLRFVDRPLPPGATSLERFSQELWGSAFDEERNRYAGS